MPGPLPFDGVPAGDDPDPRARVSLGGLRIQDSDGRLRVEPGAFPLAWTAAWLVFVATLGIWGAGRSIEAANQITMVVVAAFLIPAFLAILHGLNRQELARGAFLEIDRTTGTIVAPRAGVSTTIAEVRAVRLRIGRWRDPDGWGDVARIGLLLLRDPQARDVPLLWGDQIREVEALAGRLAAAIERPLEVDRRDWM